MICTRCGSKEIATDTQERGYSICMDCGKFWDKDNNELPTPKWENTTEIKIPRLDPKMFKAEYLGIPIPNMEDGISETAKELKMKYGGMKN